MLFKPVDQWQLIPVEWLSMLSLQLQAQAQYEKRAGNKVLEEPEEILLKNSNAFVTVLELHAADGPKPAWSRREM